MKRSLIKQLAGSITLFALLALLLTAGLTFYYAFNNAFRLQDDILQQTAQLVTPDEALPEVHLHNRDNRIFIQNQRTDAKAAFFMPNLQSLNEGFHHVTHGKARFRAYVRTVDGVNIATLFDEKEFRDEIALHAAWLATAPLVVFVLCLIPFAIWRIRRSLSPIDRLSREVAKRSGQDISALHSEGIASELQGFITALNQLLAKVRESQAQQQRFVADAAHELRSPLSALSLQIERLSEQPLPSAASRELASVRQGVQRMRHLLEQLLSLAKMQSAQDGQSAVILPELICRVLEAVLPAADAKQIDIGITHASSTPIMANDSALFVLLKTLCENAIHYTPTGGQVDVRVREMPAGMAIEVEDNGIGIALDERARVCEPFYRVLGTGVAGTGLGLAIANTIVAHHGGTLVLSDAPHFAHGLNVCVYLPFAR